MRKIKEEDSFFYKRNDLMKDWDFDKNKIDPKSVLCGSHAIVFWKCHKCGHEWSSELRHRAVRNCSCSACIGKIPIVGISDFKTLFPQIASEWNYDKNKNLSPEDFRPSSGKVVWWTCPICGNIYKKSIVKRTQRNQGCPECNKGMQTSFAEQCVYYYIKNIYNDAINRYKPEWLKPMEVDIFIPSLNIAIEYDGYAFHDKRNKIDIDKRKYGKLKSNNILLLRIRERESIDKISDVSIVTKNNWKYKDLENAIKEIFKILNIPIHGDFINIERDKHLIFNKCKKKKLEKPFYYENTQLLKEWNYEKNNGINPECISSGSGLRVWWKCLTCGGEWQTSVYNRTNGTGCPCCNRHKVLPGKTDLKTVFPEVAKEWSSKNEESPENIYYYSTKEYLWECSKCGFEWKASVVSRTGKNGEKPKGSPCCANQIIRKGINDLFTTHPEVRYLWDFNKNTISPYRISYNSQAIIWWKCTVCGESFCQRVNEFVNSLKICDSCTLNNQSENKSEKQTSFP